jgi:purine-nucleoside/S-methyl-5'-thioadenosine phosphorylase / adenosine deaminase
VNVIRPKVFGEAGSVVAAVSTREGGGALGMNLSYNVGDRPENVSANRIRFFGSLSIAPAELAIPQQVHSATVKRVSAPGSNPECDALISNARRLFLCVTVADCVPILLYAPDPPAVGIVHAGWRGTLARITTAAVASMMREFSSRPSQLLAYLGPSAGVCCYTVGEEVASQFDSRFLQRHTLGVSLDLKAANVAQLEELGIPLENIEVSPYCTISEPRLFHSYRRDGKSSGRMMGVIGLL